MWVSPIKEREGSAPRRVRMPPNQLIFPHWGQRSNVSQQETQMMLRSAFRHTDDPSGPETEKRSTVTTAIAPHSRPAERKPQTGSLTGSQTGILAACRQKPKGQMYQRNRGSKIGGSMIPKIILRGRIPPEGSDLSCDWVLWPPGLKETGSSVH